jgi:hypothetical protein
MSNPLQTDLLIFGTCSPADFGEYERYFNATYRSGPILDRFGRRIIFHENSARHVCFSDPKYGNSDRDDREVWRPDRATRIPWIGVALTHKTSLLKWSKEPGKQCFLVRMQLITESGLQVGYYQVVVKPALNGKESIFKTAYPLDQYGWAEAMRQTGVRLNR